MLSLHDMFKRIHETNGKMKRRKTALKRRKFFSVVSETFRDITGSRTSCCKNSRSGFAYPCDWLVERLSFLRCVGLLGKVAPHKGRRKTNVTGGVVELVCQLSMVEPNCFSDWFQQVAQFVCSSGC